MADSRVSPPGGPGSSKSRGPSGGAPSRLEPVPDGPGNGAGSNGSSAGTGGWRASRLIPPHSRHFPPAQPLPRPVLFHPVRLSRMESGRERPVEGIVLDRALKSLGRRLLLGAILNPPDAGHVQRLEVSQQNDVVDHLLLGHCRAAPARRHNKNQQRSRGPSRHVALPRSRAARLGATARSAPAVYWSRLKTDEVVVTACAVVISGSLSACGRGLR